MTEKAQAAQMTNLDPHWKCGNCGNTLQAPAAPETCPSCSKKCEFKDVSCYTPDCGGPGKIDPRLL
ncbi:rubredoxin-like domain-containing protein [Desulfosediminicola flagellatus]|uniref:rubredoxin-like domain-containing protein n=1 Tax=Desulfosediminicola flagellatus TaxID=2569541 RepID=UPI0010AC25EF|nr:hypothetical protein [Desulfosediminicola flagellatus]